MGFRHMGPMQIDALGPQVVCYSGADVGPNMGPIYFPCNITHVVPYLEIIDKGPIWAHLAYMGLPLWVPCRSMP